MDTEINIHLFSLAPVSGVVGAGVTTGSPVNWTKPG